MKKPKVMEKASSPSLKHSSSMNGRKQQSLNGRSKSKKLMREMVGGEPYEYYPVGRYIVCAPEVCRGRPTFKYTRIDIRHALGLLAAGRTIETVAKGYELPVEAIQEALELAAKALHRQEKEYAKAA